MCEKKKRIKFLVDWAYAVCVELVPRLFCWAYWGCLILTYWCCLMSSLMKFFPSELVSRKAFLLLKLLFVFLQAWIDTYFIELVSTTNVWVKIKNLIGSQIVLLTKTRSVKQKKFCLFFLLATCLRYMKLRCTK